jgi:hypothetical protein
VLGRWKTIPLNADLVTEVEIIRFSRGKDKCKAKEIPHC